MIPIESSTLRFGIGCFETMKIYANQKIAFFPEHIKRLIHGSQICGLTAPSEKEIFEQVKDYLSFNSLNGKEAILRLIITPETGLKMFIQAYNNAATNIKLRTSSIWSLQASSPLNSFKSFNYLKNYLACKEAQEAGFDDCLLLNEKSEIAETTKANLFFLTQDNKWLTPALASGCLPGIIRSKLINFLQAIEQNLYLRDLKNIKTIIATNSLIEAQNVIAINDLHFEEINLSEIKNFLRMGHVGFEPTTN